MEKNLYWADRYIEKQKTGEEAIKMIKPGQRLFIGSSCGEPQHLVRVLSEVSNYFTDIEIVNLLSLENMPLTLIATKTHDQILNLRSFYPGSAKPKRLYKNLRFITPMNLSAIPKLFKSRKLPINVALIQVSPPDDFGWMSLGISVDITMAAAQSADLVIAQVNTRMPRVHGRSFIHVNDVDVFVEYDEPLLMTDKSPELESANNIGRLITRLIDDGSTLQISPGTTPHATMLALKDKNDLGIHTQYLTNDIMNLYAIGVINNSYKGYNDGKMVASSAIGDENLYEFINDNPLIELHPSDYVNDPRVISRHKRMVALNVATAIDLTGQVAADSLPYNQFAGVTGMMDFIHGAAMAEGGKSILMVPSTDRKGVKSRIIPMLNDVAVVVPRSEVHYVATEYGVVNLFGKSFQERAIAMISIAHPNFRDELFFEAKKMGLFSPERTLTESMHGVYPIKLEETITIGSEIVTIRPAKPVDERRIQEHYYNLEKSDIVSRFFHEKTSFLRKEVQGISQIDYVKNLTLLAVVGEFGFGKVIALGEYLIDASLNMAEVAFSVNKNWQGKGIAKILLKKLAEAAKENEISGLIAYTSRDNTPMINLFKTLPYKVKTAFDDDILVLSCCFAELNENIPKEGHVRQK